MPIQILPFSVDLLPQAAELLARRHKRARTSARELPPRYEDPAAAGQAIRQALQRKNAHGYAATENGRLSAYLIGDTVIEESWGRSGWVRPAGCVYDAEVGVETIRDLYAKLGADWVANGIFTHIAQIPTSDPALVHAWFSLSFGIEQVYALLDLDAVELGMPQIPPGLEIRQAGPGDRQHLAEMSDVIWKTQIQSPVWAAMLPEMAKEYAEGWAEQVDEADMIVWLALQNGKPVGVQMYSPAEPVAVAEEENLFVPEKCVSLPVAGTRADARGGGIGTLLTQYGLAQAKARGFRFCDTDWRSTNLLASRFWPRRGFRPVGYRLVRRIDQRIAWAKGV